MSDLPSFDLPVNKVQPAGRMPSTTYRSGGNCLASSALPLMRTAFGRGSGALPCFGGISSAGGSGRRQPCSYASVMIWPTCAGCCTAVWKLCHFASCAWALNFLLVMLQLSHNGRAQGAPVPCKAIPTVSHVW
jgi:hypothetical protein